MKQSEFLKQHSDYAAAAAWAKANLETDQPPVRMEIGGVCSSTLPWKREIGVSETFTDYPNDNPVQRTEQKVAYVTEGLRIDMQISSYPDFPVVEYAATLTNTSAEPTPVIRDLKAIDAVITKEPLWILHANRGCTSGGVDFEPLQNAMLSFSTDSGRPTHRFLPNFNVEQKKGGGVIAVLSWQGCWKAEFIDDADGVKMVAGQQYTKFVLLPGETVRIPRMVLLYYKGSWIDGQNMWRRWFVKHNSTRMTGVRMWKCACTACTTGDPTANNPFTISNATKIMAFVERAKENGTAKFYYDYAQDAGWYPMPNGDWYYTGNWYPDPARFPDGLRPVVDKIHACGFKFRLWFEPERLFNDSDTAKILGPDRIIDVEPDNKEPHSCLINYGKPGVVDYVFDLIHKTISENDIDIFRQDFNIDPTPFWRYQDIKESKAAGVPRYGITENQYTTAYLIMWTRLAAAHPGMMFDGCASGGTRLDLDSMRFSFAHTRSDNTKNAINNQNQTYGIAMWYTYYGCAPASIKDLWERRSILSISTGRGDNFTSYEEGLPYFSEWQTLADYVLYDYYPLTDYPKSWIRNGVTVVPGVVAMQFDSPEEGRGMAAIYARGEAAKKAQTVKCKGLDAEAGYRIWSMDTPDDVTIVSGKLLLEEGITTDAKENPNYAYIYLYERV